MIVEIVDGLYINPQEISSTEVHTGSDNYTLGLYIYMKSGKTHYIKHSNYNSIFDVLKKLKALMNED
jgi:hypothetical protein